jgi:hypothetical protein
MYLEQRLRDISKQLNRIKTVQSGRDESYTRSWVQNTNLIQPQIDVLKARISQPDILEDIKDLEELVNKLEKCKKECKETVDVIDGDDSKNAKLPPSRSSSYQEQEQEQEQKQYQDQDQDK